MSVTPVKSTDAEHLRRMVEEDKAEEQRREEGKDEAARRQRVKKHLADWPRLHDLLEPESAQEEADECDATLRIQEGDTFQVAMERETALAVGGKLTGHVTARSIALRVTNAYDEEYAYALESLPQDAVTAERVYAHILSYDYLEKHIPPYALRSVARRATVLLLNRRYLAKTAKTKPQSSITASWAAAAAADSAARDEMHLAANRPVPVPAERELCLDCGRDVSTPGPGCASCEKTVS